MARARVVAVPGYKRGVTPGAPAGLPKFIGAELAKLQQSQPNTRTVKITEDYTASPLDRTLLVDTSAGNVTITLFKATQLITLPISIIKTSSDGNSVTVNAFTGDQIGTTTSITWTSIAVSYSMHPDGVDHWYVEGTANVVLPTPWTVLTGIPANITSLAALIGSADTLPYFTALGTLALTSLTSYGRTLIACANATAARTALGLGSLATASSIIETDLNLSDVTTANVSSTKHGLAPKSPADATKFLNGAATPAYAQVKDSDLSTSDITTNDASTSKHGFLKKLSGNATQFMDGSGNWSAPASGIPALPTFPTLSGTIQLQLSAESTRCTYTKSTDGFISQMNDASGNWGSNFTASTTTRPRWMKRAFGPGRPGIAFNGSTSKLVAGATKTLAQPCTVITVFKEYINGTSDGNQYRDSNLGPVFFISASTNWAIFAGSGIVNAALYTQNTQALPQGSVGATAVSIQVYNGASSLVSNNGVEATGNAGTTGFSGTLHIGGNATGTTFAKMVLYEILIVSGAMSPTDRAAINTYYSTALEIDL